jgi:hypothetical protein
MMPDESCRSCGGMLLEYLICADCREVVQFVCRICSQKTVERFHDGFCFNSKNKDALAIMPIILKSSSRKFL